MDWGGRAMKGPRVTSRFVACVTDGWRYHSLTKNSFFKMP